MPPGCATRRRRSPAPQRRTPRLAFSLDGVDSVAPEQAAQAVVEGVLLARYSYDPLRRQPRGTAVTRLTIVADASDKQSLTAGAERGKALAAATQLARDLANTPHSHLNATRLAEVADGARRASAASRSRSSTRTPSSRWAAAACSASTRAAPSRRA